jgi:uroporphyrinogen decarboxylase
VLDKLQYVFDAVSSIRKALDGRVPLIGFSGSPFTLACYMIEGGGSDDFRHVKAMLYSRPELLHHILAVNAQTVTDYLNAQIDAGAQAVQIFDTWGGALSHAAYKEFSLAYMQRIVSGLKREADGRRVPVIVFTKNGGQWLEDIAAIGADCVGLDWTTILAWPVRVWVSKVALQGNFDPNALFGSPAAIEAEAGRILAAYGRAPAMSSTWDMAFPSMPIRPMPPHWLKLYIACPVLIISKSIRQTGWTLPGLFVICKN